MIHLCTPKVCLHTFESEHVDGQQPPPTSPQMLHVKLSELGFRGLCHNQLWSSCLPWFSLDRRKKSHLLSEKGSLLVWEYVFLRQDLIRGKLIQPAVRHRNCVLSLISFICLNSHRVCFYRILVLIIFSKIILMQFAGDTNMTQMCTAVNANNAERGVIYLSSGPGATRWAGQVDAESLRSGLQIFGIRCRYYACTISPVSDLLM